MEDAKDLKHSDSDPEKPTIPEADIENRRVSRTPLELLSKIRQQDDAHPSTWPAWQKWIIVFIYCLLEVFVTLTSTTYVSVEFLIQEKWPCSQQVVTLGQSLFIIGTAVGPAFLGPLSDFFGRKWVYVGSIFLYAVLNIGAALAINLPMLIIFCFLIGLAGSTALSNVAGTISDLFGDDTGAAQPMALFVLGANFGPSLGSPIGEWIADNPHMSWRWIFYINIIIGGAFAFGMMFIPETLPRIVISNKVRRRGSVDENALEIARESVEISPIKELWFVFTMAMRILFTEPIVMFLGL
jgi:multidrug resistance protein